MKARLGLLACLLALALPVSAADYLFSLPQVECTVTVRKDASIHIAYDFHFHNSPHGRAIDVVDVGFPTKAYRLDSVTATQDGEPVRDIRPSSYIEVGVELHLPQPIPAGERSLVHVEGVNPDMVYQDTTDPTQASLRFAPTWFGSQYIQGSTRLTLVVSLPQGVTRDALRWQLDRPWTRAALVERLPSAIWIEDLRFDHRELFGLSFPRRVMDSVVEQSWLELFEAWYSARPGVVLAVVGALFLLFTIAFFRLTSGTGGCLFFILLPAWFVAFLVPVSHLVLLPLVVGFLVLAEHLRRRRKRKYLPAVVSVEGGTIKRGLTAPEAAVLLELPIGKVLTLVLFGLVRKGIVEVVSDDPLEVRLAPAWREGDLKHLADEAGLALHPYETPFITALRQTPVGDLSRTDLSAPFKELVRHTALRIQGFDLERTREYYERIVARAWKKAERLGEVEQRKTVDRNFDWMTMDQDFGRRWSRLPHPYPGPGWWPRTVPGRVEAPAGAPAPAPDTVSPSLGDVASSLAGRMENMAGSLAGRVDAGVFGPVQPVVDLSGFDRISTDMLKAMAASSGGGGGGSGCACAGCACACACAGGGR